MEVKFERVAEDSPDRCQSGGMYGQCNFKAIKSSQYCPKHGGMFAANAEVTKSKRAYQLAKWQARVDDFADEDSVKTLRGEIGITRMVLEATLQDCKNANQLLINSTKIGDLVLKIEKLVSSCSRLEATAGLTLGKASILDLASKMIAVIGNHVEDPDILARISDDFVQMLLPAKG